MYIEDDVNKYRDCMTEIKARIALVKRFTTGELTLGNESFSYEAVSVNLRKILELIAFASLTAHRETYWNKYKTLGDEKSFKPMLQRITTLNPRFYPESLLPPIRKEGTNHSEYPKNDKPFLTRSELEDLFGICSQTIHAWNPYKTGRTIDFKRPVAEWITLIEQLLNVHKVQLESGDVLVVTMNSAPDGFVHILYAVPTPMP